MISVITVISVFLHTDIKMADVVARKNADEEVTNNMIKNDVKWTLLSCFEDKYTIHWKTLTFDIKKHPWIWKSSAYEIAGI